MSSTEPGVRSASTDPEPLRTAEEARDLLNQLELSTWTLAASAHLAGSGALSDTRLDPRSAEDEAAAHLLVAPGLVRVEGGGFEPAPGLKDLAAEDFADRLPGAAVASAVRRPPQATANASCMWRRSARRAGLFVFVQMTASTAGVCTSATTRRFSWPLSVAAIDSERMATPSPRMARSAIASGALASQRDVRLDACGRRRLGRTRRECLCPAGMHTIG